MKKEMKNIFGTILLCALVLVASLCVYGQGQVGKYIPFTLSQPRTDLPANSTTNLLSGWSTSVITTNTTQAWVPSTASMTTNTTYVTNTYTSYAEGTALGQQYVPIQLVTTLSNPSPSTVGTYTVIVARSVDKTNWDTYNNITNTMTGPGTNGSTTLAQAAAWDVTMKGFGYWRVVSFGYSGTNTGVASWSILSATKTYSP